MNSVKTPKDNVILVPIDFSTASANAVEHAVGIAELFDNEIALLYVVKESLFKTLFGSNVEKSLLMDRISQQLEERKKMIVEKHPNLVVETIVKEGTVYKQIIETASNH